MAVFFLCNTDREDRLRTTGVLNWDGVAVHWKGNAYFDLASGTGRASGPSSPPIEWSQDSHVLKLDMANSAFCVGSGLEMPCKL